MNTDNMSILGLTIDYGPYGWIDDYDPDWTPNTTDAQGRRYRFGWQPAIVRWNLGRLAQAISPLLDDASALQAGIERFGSAYTAADRDNTARKLGLRDCREEDVVAIRDLYTLLHESEADMTLAFRALVDIDLDAPSIETLRDAFYDATKRDAFRIRTRWQAWLDAYAARVREDALPLPQRCALMQAANPKFVLRNYLAQQAIDRAEQGDFDGVTDLLDLLRRPYDEQPARAQFAQKRPDWARSRAGCSMLSCSS
jgi:serine/tyrosine/threonine adenylyltransferase